MLLQLIGDQLCVSDVEKQTFSCLVLTMLFSQGESVPLQYYDHLNTSFVTTLLRYIEDASSDDVSQQVRAPVLITWHGP